MQPQHAVVVGLICLALVAAGYGAEPVYGSTSEGGGYG
jgi:hypothetical protein